MLKKKSMFLPLNLQYFAKGEGQGEGDVDPNTAPNVDEVKGEDVKAPENTNTIPYERFKSVNEKAKTYENTLKELGFNGLEDLKTFAQTAKELQEKEDERKRGELSDIEKLQLDLEKASKTITDLTGQLTQTQEQSKQEKIVNAFIKKATENNIAYIDDALKLADLSKLELTENGIEGLEEVVKSLVESKPFLVKQVATPKQIGETNNPPQHKTDKSKDQLLNEAADKARKSGRIEDKIAYATLKKELGF